MANTNYHKIKSYKKDKKISIVERKEIIEEGMPGRPVTKPIPGGANIWAYYRHASASEVNNAGLAGHKVEAIFRINWRDDINTKMRIQYKDNDYKITRIDDYEGYKNDLTIYAYTVNPKDDE